MLPPQGRIPWDPDTMRRAVAEGKGGLDERIVVINCADFHVDANIKPSSFFTGCAKFMWLQCMLLAGLRV
jgi:hypothetical protein